MFEKATDLVITEKEYICYCRRRTTKHY